MTDEFSTPNNEPPEGAAFDAHRVGRRAAALANAGGGVGGRAGLILLWDRGAGRAVHSSGVGLAAADRAELEALVSHAAPALLGALPIDGAGDDAADEATA